MPNRQYGLANPGSTGLSVGGGALTGALDLGGQFLYGSTTSELNGGIKYFPSKLALAVGVKANSPTDGRGVVIGVFGNTLGINGDYTNLSGFQILEFGDVGLCGSSSNLANINTVDASSNDHTFMLGGGATLKRGFAFQMYNNGKFAGETYDMAASANEQGLLHLSSGVNQSGTASYSLIRGEVHESSTGSGFHRLLDLGINSGTSNFMVGANVNDGTDAAGYTPKFVVTSAGLVGLLTGSPTHTLTLDQNGTIAQYNTALNSTNYERVVSFWTSNTFVIQAQAGGSGVSRPLEMIYNDASGVLISDGGAIQLRGSSAGYTFLQVLTDTLSLDVGGRITTANQPNVRFRNVAGSGAFTASSGTQQAVQVLSTFTQTSTAAWTGIEVNVTDAGSNTGAKYLYDGIVGGASKFHVDSTGLPYNASGALTAGTMTATTSSVVPKVVHRYDWTNAMVTALGAVTAGDVAVCTLPAKTVVTNAYVVIKTAAGTVTTLTVALGRTSAAYIDYIVASDAKAGANTVYGDVSGERGTNLTGYDLPSYTGTTVVNAHFISTGGNLNTVTTSTGTIFLETMLLP